MSCNVSLRWCLSEPTSSATSVHCSDRPLWSALARNPVGPGERHLCHCGSLHRQGHQIFWLKIVDVALAVGPGNRLTLERQDAEVVGKAPAGFDCIDPPRK